MLFGAAYYTEYLTAGREDIDFAWMREAGMNTIRIAESTWGAYEPREGEFDFSAVTRVLKKATAHGLQVIVGTPTYAIPPWLALKYPSVIAETHQGQRQYGARQIMDITNEHYRFYAERIIRKLLAAAQGYDCVIGFQLDNETKHYDVCSETVQKRFVNSLKDRFGTVDAMNDAFGLNYWSNRIGSWEEFPDVRGTVNASLGCAFSAFQRSLVTEFLAWQAGIVLEYARPDQLITHNFDFEWRGHSFGVQPDADHSIAAGCLSVAGCDIYHPSQSQLTGREIAFCGDVTRCLKHAPYLVIETQAQGFPQWTPFPGQLKLQAFAHVASGAKGVMYWHWHSLHNAFETYWKGVLSHDLECGAAYGELVTVGSDFARLSSVMDGYQKQNRAAILVSNAALSAVDAFRIPGGMPMGGKRYNDIVRLLYDACYDINLEVDVLFGDANLDGYNLLLVPCLYTADDALLDRLRHFVKLGGRLISLIKTGFCDENVKVRAQRQPARLTDVFGCSYEQFTQPEDVCLEDGTPVSDWMELLRPQGATVLARYVHPAWKDYAAVTQNQYGDGYATYLGCLPDQAYLSGLVAGEAARSGLSLPAERFPVIVRGGTRNGKRVAFYMNFSGQDQSAQWQGENATEFFSRRLVTSGDLLSLAPWGIQILEEQ